MIVTVCELPDERSAFEDCWAKLAGHVRKAGGGAVVLPGMPFSAWFTDSTPVDAARWNAAVAAHDAWEHRLAELGATLVLGSRPIDFGNERYDEGFAWAADTGVRSVHARATHDFVPLEIDSVDIGLLIDEEVWVRDGPQPYARGVVDIIAIPRCTRFAGLTQRLDAWHDHSAATLPDAGDRTGQRASARRSRPRRSRARVDGSARHGHAGLRSSLTLDFVRTCWHASATSSCCAGPPRSDRSRRDFSDLARRQAGSGRRPLAEW
jgi:hypothetical protein